MAKKEVIQFFQNLGGKQLVDEIKASEKLIERQNKRFESKKPRPAPWQSIGAVKGMIPYAYGARFACDNGWVELHWIAPDCVRVRLQIVSGEFYPPFSYTISRVDWPIVPVEIIEGEDALELRTSELVCRVGKRPFRIGLETLDGQHICVDRAGMRYQADGPVSLSMAMSPDEACYGMGERAAGLNLRGKQLKVWNTDPPDYERGTDPLYYNIPFYLGVHNNGAYGIFWDNTNRGVADLSKSKQGELLLASERGELRYYLFAGKDVNNILSRYTELTGRIRLPPRWALGYHQSRFSYHPQEAVQKLAREMRERSVPCDAIYLDIHYMDGFRVFTWNRELFPDLKQMLAELHATGIKVVVIVDPGIKIDDQYKAYQTGIQEDIFLKYPDGELVSAAVWPGLCHFPDFSKPAARAWWGEQIKELLDLGIDGIWNDMCEPVIFTLNGVSLLPDYIRHDQDGLRGDHEENHNIYGMLMARASLEATEKYRPGKRQLNITRAGFAGAQRYAASWTGDNASSWDHLRLSISMALNMGLSGAPMTGPDIGGFRDDADGELFTRWLQAACLLPYFRTHSSIGTADQEPWAFGQPYEVINRMTIELRYRLMPYLYSVVAQSAEFGWPVIRPIFMAEPDNADVRSIDDCYMLGGAILVAPVVEQGAVARSLYLPAGKWYDFWTNELFRGGQEITVTAPLERLPLFVRAGAVLPLWPEMPYVQEPTSDMLVMRVYPGDFETVLYEDKGEGLEYQHGDYRWVYVTCAWEESRLVIDRRVAGKYEPHYAKIKLEVVGFDEEPAEVRVDRQGAPLWFYDDELLELTVDPFKRVEIRRKALPTDRTIARRPW
jgi:alpha-glucosidase